jgi:type IV secretory pathway VirJ component
MSAETCPHCRRRRARRACPALGHQICAVCCGTKRLTEIRCPSDCTYLVSARTHPPAVVQRQQECDARFLLPIIDGLGRRQYQLFFAVQATIHRLADAEEMPVNDDVVRDTAQALAATYETANKGIIYEHRPSSLPAGRLARELKPLLEGKDEREPVANERDLADVLRRVERAATDARKTLDGGTHAYLDLVGRLIQPSFGDDTGVSDATAQAKASDVAPSLVIP